MSYLKVVNINKSFGDFIALDNINIEAEEREFVTFLGPSGCGKTTLLKMLAGFTEPDSGDIYFDGVVQNAIPPEKRDSAMCFQSYALFPHMSVNKNIGYGLKMQGVKSPQLDKEVAKFVDVVNLGEHCTKLPSELSGGQQQRVALARALAVTPKVIMFDEPLSNLDAKLRDSVRIEIKQLQRTYNLTAIYVTHDQAEALAISDKVVVLNRGQIEQQGTPHDIYYYPKNRFVADFIGSANIMAAKQITPSSNGYSMETAMGTVSVNNNQPNFDASYIMWRPESAIIVDSTEGYDNCYTVRVKEKVFMGNLTEFHVVDEKSHIEVRIQSSFHSDIQEGQLINIVIPSEKIAFLDEACN